MGLIVTKLNVFNYLEENIKFVGITLLITALCLFLIRNIKGEKTSLSFKSALNIGLFQVLALIPGISRSGATIVGGMLQGLKKDAAFDFSFMLYIPISLATTFLGISDLLDADIGFKTFILYIIAAITAFFFTFITTSWFRKIVVKGKMVYFSIYCALLGIFVLIFL
jgi:undecaprenyl-diphosphatase